MVMVLIQAMILIRNHHRIVN
ncbi:hypothetical protein BLA29_014735 [Euroglyphus maynei]|uniref:Uncharacterized protein n=1 Tax=Euroglyphus maynei TaxID=6958 RepID=A0A1Y3BEU5_EURMA|nr:hypothetical protein BLA29_014735 [Euroglyphus maynei]